MSTFLQIITVGFSMLSAFFLLGGAVSLSPGKIVKLVINRNDNHTKYAKEMISEMVTARLGFLALLLSFNIQIYRIMKPLTWDDLETSYIGGIMGITVIAVSFFIGICLRKYITCHTLKEIKKEFSKTIYAWDEKEEI